MPRDRVYCSDCNHWIAPSKLQKHQQELASWRNQIGKEIDQEIARERLVWQEAQKAAEELRRTRQEVAEYFAWMDYKALDELYWKLPKVLRNITADYISRNP